MKEYLKEIVQDIQGRTEKMNREEKWRYIITYYWYHILGIFTVVFLFLFLVIHFGFGEEKPEFTCVMVNQEIDPMRDRELAEAFAGQMGLETDTVVIDSDFNLSYGEVKLEGINESSFEKFFFKWQNDELDAVILPESFYEYCKEAGGTFVNVSQWDTGTLSLYQDKESGEAAAIRVEDTWLASGIENKTGELLLLSFPSNGEHPDMCQKFLAFLNEMEREHNEKTEY